MPAPWVLRLWLANVPVSLPRRGYVGLQVAPVPETAPPGPGLFVRDVQLGSPAERAGARPGDRLRAIGGHLVNDMTSARTLLRALPTAATFELTVERDGATLTLHGAGRAMPVEQHAAGQIVLDEVAVGQFRLRAIALVPDTPGPHPTLYYLPGAHWASEEYPFELDQPVPALLGTLAAHGVASLRVERFGMGDSEGPPCNAVDFEQEFAGYRAGLTLLARASWCDPSRVVLWGHSLGAMVAPLLAEVLPSELTLRGVVTFGASAIPIADGLVGALERHAERQPQVPASTVARQGELLREIVEGGKTPAQALHERPDLRDVVPEHFTDTTIYRRNVAFYHQLQRQPLKQAWSRVNAPVLALHGARDWICSFSDSERIAALSSRGEAVQVVDTSHHLSEGDVTFLRDPTTRPPRLRLSPHLASIVLERLRHWL